MRFAKYQALANDYLVLDAAEFAGSRHPELVRRITDRRLGVGADGVLVGARPGSGAFGLRIFNPDGSEAEKSGNGLRIFARSLWDSRAVSGDPFEVETLGGVARCRVIQEGRSVRVSMGRVVFDSESIPVQGPAREVLNESLWVADRRLEFCGASVGNPHCVVLVDAATEADARLLGPAIESDPRFPNRTNVQFAQVQDRGNLRIEIWERGAGYTLASGTSACAAAGVAIRLGLCDRHVSVHMRGGVLEVEFTADFEATIEGPVVRVAEGEFFDEALAAPAGGDN